ncbi:NUDIX hydrolase [Microvirga subterranea]|uniref:ADP-ribose pyrophosphatase YjhB (NUDIX family) n=1 Tax=Microvirga subterranea TaxID=186651 RepID=A0A370HIR7_9HYPH|nr:NUDIX domain-containing protein [Microvirga subterranea]RDI57845.1 ADP-ribose pyrophosphatase YjhB (NUDIX family) [Microvirga subterranea]
MCFDPAAFRQHVQTVLDRYAEHFAVPVDVHEVLRRQIAEGSDIHSRRTFPGHVTTSAIVLDRAGRRTLLISHRALARWLQPGGHYEAPEELTDSALREAVEETGLQGLSLDSWHAETNLPIDIDSHVIPARPERGEPEHWHHDIRYVVRADESAGLRPDLAEVEKAAWHDVSALAAIMPRALRHLDERRLIRHSSP